MAIAKYIVRCPGCAAVIHLRIGVGVDDEQAFYFVCRKCNAPTRGTQFITYSPPRSRITLESGEALSEHLPADQVITLHPDLPSLPHAADIRDKGGSPWLMLGQILGDRIAHFSNRLRDYREGYSQNWPGIRRWASYYLSEDWSHFDQEAARLWGDVWPKLPTWLDRHDFFHKSLDLVTAPLWNDDSYALMKVEWVDLVVKATENRGATLAGFYSQSKGEVLDLQRDVFGCLDLLLSNAGAFTPALALDMCARAGRDPEALGMRLFRDDFPKLRDVYITTFESCHHALFVVAGTLNVLYRGGPDNFPSGGPRGLQRFRKQKSFEKVRILSELQVWEKQWTFLFDRRLRNAIGHHSIRHDLVSGLLVERQSEPIPYTRFIVQVLRLVQACLVTAHLLKYVHLVPQFEAEGDADL